MRFPVVPFAFWSALACVVLATACGGAAPETAAMPAAQAPASVPAPADASTQSTPCGPDRACATGLVCAPATVVPHTGQALWTCELPCRTDADCDSLTAPEERACVAASRTRADCQCAPGTARGTCGPAAGDAAVQVCQVGVFQDYGRPRCE